MPAAADLAAYASVLSIIIGLNWKLWDIIKKRRQEKRDIESRLDTAPLDRESIEVTLTDRRLGQLDRIITSQARHMEWQDKELKTQDKEIRECNARIRSLISELTQTKMERDSLRRRLDGTHRADTPDPTSS